MPLIPRLVLILTVLVVAGSPVAGQTGPEVPEMANYDAFFPGFLARYGIPGAAVAVSKDGRLVYARGFGLADVDAGEPVRPESRFRVASVSKPITAVVTMALVEDGRLDLDAPAFGFLDDLPVPEGQSEDPRLAQITVRDLLQHSGGWDRDGTGYDPMFDVVRIASVMGAERPADTETIIRYMRGRPLDFDPGARHAYSNLGYAVLGEVLERVTGQPYEALVQETLDELGMESLELARTLLDDRLPDEVRYYPLTDIASSVFDGGQVPWPYGGFYIEAMDAHGGWAASAPDLLRFTAALDGLPNRPDLLSASSQKTMTARPSVPTWNGATSWYGFGWAVNTNGHWWHLGSLPGSESLLVRSSYEGLHWAVLLNARTGQSGTYMRELDNAMWNLALGVEQWPTHDLFDQGVSAQPPPVEAVAALDVAPNPARAATALTLTLPEAGAVAVSVYDVLGREVVRLHDGPLAAGTLRLTLDASPLPAGVYVVRAVTPAGTASRTVTVAR